MKSKQFISPIDKVDSLQIIQLLYAFKYYENQLNPYKKQGICYGFGYTNAYALLLSNETIINQRAKNLSQLNTMACSIAEKKLNQHHIITYQSNLDKYYNILDYLLISLRDNKKQDDLTLVLEEIRVELINYLNSQIINGENAAVHLNAYFDNICLFYKNELITRSSEHSQNARDLFDSLNPVQMTENDMAVHSAESFSGIFNQIQLCRVLELFALEIAKTNFLKPIVLVLSGNVRQPSPQSSFFNVVGGLGHTISISFDPKNKKWNFIDSLTSRVTHFEIEDTMDLSIEIMKEFCMDKQLYDYKKIVSRDFFIHVLVAQKKNSTELSTLNQAISMMKESDEWNNELMTGCTLFSTINLINNCLQEGSVEEFKSLFSEATIRRTANSFTLDDRGLIENLLHLRYMDPSLVSLLKVLLDFGISMNTGYKAGENALHTLVNIFRDNIFTATMKESIHFLCSHGVDINQPTNKNNFTPLCQAIAYIGKLNIPLIETLLENHANPNILITNFMGEDSFVNTLLYYYVYPQYPIDEKEYRQSAIITMRMLINYGLNLDMHIRRPWNYQEISKQGDTVTLMDIFQHYINEYPDAHALSEILQYYASTKQITLK